MDRNPRHELMDARDELAKAIAAAVALDCPVGITAARELLAKIEARFSVASRAWGESVALIRDAEDAVERLTWYCGGYARVRHALDVLGYSRPVSLDEIAKVDAPAAKRMLADERRAAA